jgi:Mg/Co/Ni transporter MgtE
MRHESASSVAARKHRLHPVHDYVAGKVRVRERVRGSGWDQCVVVNAERIVLGRLGRRALSDDSVQTVEQAMRNGPSTVRPNVPLAQLLQKLERQDLPTALVTTSDGRLVGVVRADADGSGA